MCWSASVKTMPQGIPSSGSSGMRSRSSPEEPQMPSGHQIPAVSPNVVPRRASRSSHPHNSPIAESSDTSIGIRGRDRQRAHSGSHPGASSRSRPNVPIDLDSTQATFLAGAAISHAHHASIIANNAASVALSSQHEVQHAQDVANAIHAGAVQQQSAFAQAAAAMQQQATRAYLAQQEEARVAIEQRDNNLQLLEMRSHQQVQGILHEAEREILADRGAVQEMASQWVSDNVRPLQQQVLLGHQQIADRDSQLMEREMRIARLQEQLEALQRQNANDIPVATPNPVPDSPITIQTGFDLVDGSHRNPLSSDHLDGSANPINTPIRQPTGLSPRETPVVPINPVVSNAGQPATNFQSMFSAPSIPISFGPPAATEPHPGLPHTPNAIVPLQLGLTQLSPTPADNAVQPSVDAAASEQGTNRESIRALQDQVSKLTQALRAQTLLAIQLQQAAKAPFPIAPPCTPPAINALGGAQNASPVINALGGTSSASPVINALGGAATSAPCRLGRQAAGSAHSLQQVLPPGLPPLPLSRLNATPPGLPYVYNTGSQRSHQSGSSESSSVSDVGAPPPNPYTQCRICGEFHKEINCPYSKVNAPQGGGFASDQGFGQLHPENVSRNFADEEDDTIRVKSLNDLVFPSPPENAGQARGYVNQVLMAIGKLQKTPGSDVYQWAQECLTFSESDLKADPRYPRTDREIASKLLKTCRRGRFGLIFQQMVEAERLTSGSMPCGRVMLQKIFQYFQLERDRIGMLGERNLLSLHIAGNTHADLESFRDKYIYVMSTIPVQDLPREQTLFNHLIDELEKCSIMSAKVQKAREAPLTSHRRSTTWLWEKVELVLQLDQQRKNRLEFDKQLKLKPADGYLGTTKIAGAPADADGNPKGNLETSVPGAPAPKNNPKTKADKNKKVEAAPAPHDAKAKAKTKAKGNNIASPPPKAAVSTPRSEEASRVAKLSPAEKAKTPCIFFAYDCCRAKQCAFLHSATEKYQGPPPRSLAKSDSSSSVTANMATIAAGAAALPVVNAAPLRPDGSIPWLWDTAAGRHLIGKQALTPKMKEYLQPSPNPVAFATGGEVKLDKNPLLLTAARFSKETKFMS